MGEKKEHNIIEKIAFIIGSVVLLALISFLVYQINKKKQVPPELQITTSYQPAMKEYGYKVEVENMGEESAEAANIKLSLYQNGKLAEEGSVTLNYVPVKSKETAWIVFHTERKAGDSLVVSSVTYVKP